VLRKPGVEPGFFCWPVNLRPTFDDSVPVNAIDPPHCDHARWIVAAIPPPMPQHGLDILQSSHTGNRKPRRLLFRDEYVRHCGMIPALLA
jgi:hypothetical protein